jgi:predicted nucleic acid-binding protein
VSVVLDTGVVLALYDLSDQHHAQASAWYDTFDDELVTTPLALAEMDHLATRADARDALWGDLERGAFAVRWWADGTIDSLAVARRHPGIGFTDASLVALAGRLRTDRIATFDHQRFRALTTPGGAPFTVLPADAT